MSSEWTISTLKEHFEQQLKALSDKCDADTALLRAAADSAARELIKDAAEYERRLEGLNHEAARINLANNGNVSREVYDTDKKTTEEWRRRIEGSLAEAVPQGEYRAYKESTSTALTLQAGKREGIQGTGQIVLAAIVGGSALVAIAIGVSTFLATRSSAPAPIIYVTPPAGPVGPDATVKVRP